MTRYHLVISDGDNNIIGQFDVGSEPRRRQIIDNLPSDLSIQNERVAPDDANLGNSLSALSDNVVVWDERLEQL